ncbi:hypothetical protein [Lentilactobacillus parabuchneri]|jgi:hypothetical protein|uniref:hypothetical protein n=1 Tax=Lentilactobacillus parabuchneri TaxID=152331 RepID=UPI000A23AFEA|nr:hypothetical protein [Lentilactobacillus parabuchneri]ORM91121.1 hypothetical protein FAM21809_02187 [Lentilactobacillus parabuchneri]ORN13633.1 hypothetical protein FAM23164_02158 [Lentilactobacillus parabuchneri]ORN15403.1 hypothetical protein FAM23165_02198 [Lentilactobacillus parabuchneri]ORN18368.1 hypothetical protein FAM23166_02200 [Lentilactobacillus parabuchneri]ORN23890.1 hypothetical protein FAM23167_02179 [Lentilactobacillus parabuchneri]
MSDDMKLLKQLLEDRLKEESDGAIESEAQNGIVGGLMIALYLIDHLHDMEDLRDDKNE